MTTTAAQVFGASFLELILLCTLVLFGLVIVGVPFGGKKAAPRDEESRAKKTEDINNNIHSIEGYEYYSDINRCLEFLGTLSSSLEKKYDFEIKVD